MSQMTFGKTLASYVVICGVLAILIPTHLAIEDIIPLDPSLIPIASWLRHTPRALPSITTYFFAGTLLLPFVVALLAKNPQTKAQLGYDIPNLNQCIVGSFCVACLLLMFGMAAYGDISVHQDSHGRGGRLLYFCAISRFGLAVMGPMLLAGYALVLYLAFVKAPRMWKGFMTESFG